MSDSIGPYQVVRKLGAGGMGEVFLARDPRIGRLVALKRPSDDWLRRPSSGERLRREARAAGQLNHPNIAAVYDVLDVDDRPHIVMEYVEGETLAAIVSRGPLPIAQVLDLGVQLADALEEAHQHGVIHRDLKPANIVLTTAGRLKILDFGLAKVQASGSAPTEGATDAGQVLGTPGYMAPEQMIGLPADTRSDIYSSGVVLYELATGRAPFAEADAVGRVLAALQQREGPRPDIVRPDVPESLAAAIARALAREPGDRFQTAADLRAALVGSRAQTDGSDVSRHDERRRFRIGGSRAAAIVGGLIAVGAAMYGLWPARVRRPVGETPIVAVLPFVNLTGETTNDSLAIGFADSLVTDLATVPDITVVRRDELRALGTKRDARSAAALLGATLIVDPSLQRAGGQLRVNVELVRADATSVWTGSYEGTTDGMFDLQRRIADGVISHGAFGPARRADAAPRSSDLAAAISYGEGRAWQDRGDVPDNLDRAVAALTDATTRDPAFAMAHAALGEAAMRRYGATRDAQWVVMALQETDRAVTLDPTLADVFVARAGVYRQTGKTPEAIAALEHAIGLQPNDDMAHEVLGDTLFDAGRREEALTQFKEAIRLRPVARHYDRLGVACFRLGRYDDAIPVLQKVVDLQPDNAPARHKLATVFQVKEDYPHALELYSQAIKIQPLAQSFLNMGVIQYDQGDNAGAVRSFSEATRLRPNEPQTHRNLGDAYRRLGDVTHARAEYTASLELLDKALQVNPGSAAMMGQRAVCLAKLGRYADAERQADKALAINAVDGEVLYRRAVVRALAGRGADALAALDAALAHGYSVKSANRDDDLERVRALPAYPALLAKFEK